MNAKDTRTLASTSKTLSDNSQFEDVIEKIISTAKNGELQLTINGSLREGVNNRLRNMGYGIRLADHRNESNTTISW